MVESGTLLRCYTSKRGIEGSNPSSSALYQSTATNSLPLVSSRNSSKSYQEPEVMRDQESG